MLTAIRKCHTSFLKSLDTIYYSVKQVEGAEILFPISTSR